MHVSSTKDKNNCAHPSYKQSLTALRDPPPHSFPTKRTSGFTYSSLLFSISIWYCFAKLKNDLKPLHRRTTAESHIEGGRTGVQQLGSRFLRVGVVQGLQQGPQRTVCGWSHMRLCGGSML